MLGQSSNIQIFIGTVKVHFTVAKLKPGRLKDSYNILLDGVFFSM